MGIDSETLGTRATGISFDLVPDAPSVEDPEDPRGRVWFTLQGGRVQYRGAAGFQFKSLAGAEDYLPRVSDVIRALG